MYSLVRKSLLILSRNTKAQSLILDVPLCRPVARRFVPGETLAEAMSVVKALNEKGMSVTLDHLGENVTNEEEARERVDAYLDILTELGKSRTLCGVSVKPSNFGIQFSPEQAYENLRRIVARADHLGRFVRLDMESSAFVESSLHIYRRLRKEFSNVGVVLQAYLHRTNVDIASLIHEGNADIRLVKGAYQESSSIAYQQMSEIREAFFEGLRLLWTQPNSQKGIHVAVASHDPKIIKHHSQLSEHCLKKLLK